MSILGNRILGGAGQQPYQVSRSLRFRASASAYLNRTPASAGNRQIWTWSGWVKRGTIGTAQQLFGAYIGSGTTDTNYFEISYNSDQLQITGYSTVYRKTTQVFRDPSAWYHVIVALDTTQATASNRVKLYINGVQVTAFATSNDPALNSNLGINGNYPHGISAIPSNAAYFDGYLAEVNFIDGQALTPSSFGAYDNNGVWQPIKYGGTYGTNGFYLPFSNTTSTTTLVQDSSGNGNNWTPNNISLTAGTTYDSMIDSPTVSTSSSNYAVLNPVDHPTTFIAPTDGNLSQNCNTAAWTLCVPTFSIPDGSGLWQWEIVQTGTANGANAIGVCLTTVQASVTGDPSSRTGCSGTNNVGQTFVNGVSSGSITYPTVGNTVTCLYDSTNKTFQVFDNGTSKGTITGLPAGDTKPFVAASSSNGSPTFVLNFGQRAFSYDKGGKALNTYNLPQPTIMNGAKYMQATLYTGNGSATQTIAQSVTGNSATFLPDFVWTKGRSSATNNIQIDTVRGGANYLISDSTSAEVYNAAAAIQSFSSNGYVIGNGGAVNTNAATYVSWQWNAGSGTTSTNTSGSISSLVSVNASAGFSIVSYVGNGTAGATVGHSLGVAPSMFVLKSRSSAQDWNLYHASLGPTVSLELNLTLGSAATSNFNSTSPTSTVFSVGSGGGSNASGTAYIAYCWSAVAGYSAFGSYAGNGSTDGPFIYTGFRPRWIMIKDTGYVAGYGDWYVLDTSRSTYNVSNSVLLPNTSNVESVGNTAFNVDFLSNGFKLRTAYQDFNASGYTYVYAAFAENPFKVSRAR